MSGPAQVRSSEAIEAFNLAMAGFADRVQNALDALAADLQRSDDWIDHNRPSHWRRQIKEAEDSLHQAKLDLERCLTMTSIDGQRPSCREQKSAVVKTKAHLEYCRDKYELVQKWQRTFRHDSMEFRGRLGQLRRVIEQDVPNSRMLLERIIRQIEAYQLERPPDALAAHSVSPAAPSAPIESNARPVAPTPAPVVPPAPTEAGSEHG